MGTLNISLVIIYEELTDAWSRAFSKICTKGLSPVAKPTDYFRWATGCGVKVGLQTFLSSQADMANVVFWMQKIKHLFIKFVLLNSSTKFDVHGELFKK